MAELAIIADDLTGALDAAAPFAMRGLETVVALGNDALPDALASGARIVGVSTDSREVAPAAARAAVREALAALSPDCRVFKKVDSRLKGNIAAELDAFAYNRSLVVPALPEFGRIARAGAIEGFGIASPIPIAGRLGGHAAKAIIPDIASAGDIETALAQPHDLAVGARGLAEGIARKMAPEASIRTPSITAGAAYCVIGSTDPITLAQLRHLRRTCAGLVDLKAPNGVWDGIAGPAQLTLLQAVPGEATVDGPSVAAALAASLRRLSPPADALLLISGGATAQSVLRALGITRLELLGEALPGLPIARAGDLTIVSKSGGFGETDSLSRLLSPYYSARNAGLFHAG